MSYYYMTYVIGETQMNTYTYVLSFLLSLLEGKCDGEPLTYA